MQITLVLPSGNNSESRYSYYMERKWSLLCIMLYLYSLETICGCQLRNIPAEKGEDLLLLDYHLPSMKVDFMFLMISCSQR